jgi:hypothetical protein
VAYREGYTPEDFLNGTVPISSSQSGGYLPGYAPEDFLNGTAGLQPEESKTGSILGKALHYGTLPLTLPWKGAQDLASLGLNAISGRDPYAGMRSKYGAGVLDELTQSEKATTSPQVVESIGHALARAAAPQAALDEGTVSGLKELPSIDQPLFEKQHPVMSGIEAGAQALGDLPLQVLSVPVGAGEKVALDPTLGLLGGLGKTASLGRALGSAQKIGLRAGEVPTAEAMAELLPTATDTGRAQAARLLSRAAGARAEASPLTAYLLEHPEAAQRTERALGASFLPGMINSAAQQIPAAIKNYRQEGLTPETIRQGVGGAVSGVFAGLGAKHALRPGVTPVEQQAKVIEDAIANAEANKTVADREAKGAVKDRVDLKPAPEGAPLNPAPEAQPAYKTDTAKVAEDSLKQDWSKRLSRYFPQRAQIKQEGADYVVRLKDGSKIKVKPEASIEIPARESVSAGVQGEGEPIAATKSARGTVSIPSNVVVELANGKPISDQVLGHEVFHVARKAIGISDKNFIKRFADYAQDAKSRLVELGIDKPTEKQLADAIEERVADEYAQGYGSWSKRNKDIFGRLKQYWSKVSDSAFPTQKELFRKIEAGEYADKPTAEWYKWLSGALSDYANGIAESPSARIAKGEGPAREPKFITERLEYAAMPLYSNELFELVPKGKKFLVRNKKTGEILDTGPMDRDTAEVTAAEELLDANAPEYSVVKEPDGMYALQDQNGNIANNNRGLTMPEAKLAAKYANSKFDRRYVNHSKAQDMVRKHYGISKEKMNEMEDELADEAALLDLDGGEDFQYKIDKDKKGAEFTKGSENVTLYRGENPDREPGSASVGQEGTSPGRGFTEDLRLAKAYAGPNGVVKSIEVPRSALENWKPENPEILTTGKFARLQEYNVPEEVALTARPIPQGDIPADIRFKINPSEQPERSTQEPPRVERNVESLRNLSEEAKSSDLITPEIQRRIDRLNKLDRDAPREWSSLEGPAGKIARERVLQDWTNQVISGRPMTDTNSIALEKVIANEKQAHNDMIAERSKAIQDGDSLKQEELDSKIFWHGIDLSTLQSIQLKDGTAAGRSLAARRYVSSVTGDRIPSSLLSRIMKEIPAISPGEAEVLEQIFHTNPEGFADAFRQASKPNLMDKVLEFWKAGLVSALPTHFANTMSNAAEQGVRIMETMTSAQIQKMLQGKDAPRSIREAAAEWTGLRSSFGPALKRFLDETKGAFTLQPEKLDMESGKPIEYSTGAIPGKTGRAVRIPFRMLDAADKFFGELALNREFHKLAYREALKEAGLKKNEVFPAYDRIFKEVKEGDKKWADLRKEAYENAQSSIFREAPDGTLRAGMHLRKELPFGIGHVVVPFLQTPWNIAKLTFKRSPFYLYNALRAYREFKAGKLDAQEASDRITRPVVGTAIATFFYGLASQGQMTGSGPTDQKKRSLMLETGWQPYSFKIPMPDGGVMYLPYNRFEPVSGILQFAADAAEADNPEMAESMFDKMTGSIVNGLVNKTFAKGLSDAAMVASRPMEVGGQYARNLAGSIVPNIVRKGTQIFDPALRDIRPSQKGWKGLEESVVGSIESGIPGLSERLPQRVTGTGTPIERKGTKAAFFLPAKPTFSEPAEVERLLVEVGYIPSEPSRTLRVGSGASVPLNDEEYNLIAEGRRVASEYIKKNLINNPAFQRLPNTEDEARKGQPSKASILKKIYSKYSDAARDAVWRKFPDLRKRGRAAIKEAKARQHPLVRGY